VKRVGIDEKSFLRGQSYITSLCDLDDTWVIEIVEELKEENASALLQSPPEDARGRIAAIAMDM
jgi:transposase